MTPITVQALPEPCLLCAWCGDDVPTPAEYRWTLTNKNGQVATVLVCDACVKRPVGFDGKALEPFD